MKAVVLLALVALCAGHEEEEACVVDVGRADVSDRGLLQLRRLRDGLSVGAGVDAMDKESLLEMKAQLASKLDRREEIKDNERGFLQDFIDYIKNTSLKYIREGSTKDQADVNTLVNEIKTCDKVLATEEEHGAWKTARTAMETAKKVHKDCRVNESLAWENPNRTCGHLNSWVNGHAATDAHPGIAEGYVLPTDPTKQQVVDWLEAFWKWHCNPVKADQFDDKVTDCKNDMTDANNTHKKCNTKQAQFEKAFCEFRTEVLAGCHEYEVCRTDVDTRYAWEVTRVTTIDQNRKVEWQILHVIICYIELLLGPKANITEAAKKACETDYPDFPKNASVVLPMTFNGTYTEGTDKMTCTQQVPEKVSPFPCDQEWIDEQFTGLPEDAPATHCTHSCAASVETYVESACPVHYTLSDQCCPPSYEVVSSEEVCHKAFLAVAGRDFASAEFGTTSCTQVYVKSGHRLCSKKGAREVKAATVLAEYALGKCRPSGASQECCSAGYEAITSQAVCSTAFDDLVKEQFRSEWKFVGAPINTTSNPHGCFYHVGDHKVRYNAGAGNALKGNDEVVCKKKA